MADLPGGAYEHVVTHELARRLSELDTDLVQREALDPADADELLARHIAGLARRALHAVPGQGTDRTAAQVALTNRIAEAIAATLPRTADRADRTDLVAASHDVLTAIVPRPPAEHHLDGIDHRSAVRGWQLDRAPVPAPDQRNATATSACRRTCTRAR
ncbi:hypothetical protein AB0I61_14095 [Polymorphospora rubra]|uniref:hypothetical protein n=1 Tax=Polymorphospora rubra TaxID=338584 RepID=UPI0033D24C6D